MHPNLTGRRLPGRWQHLNGSALLHEAILLCLDVFDAPAADRRELDNFDGAMDVFGWTAARWQMKGLSYSYGIELMVLFGLSAVVVVLAFAALCLQYRARTQEPKVFWFFRKHHHNNSRIPYIVPHPLNITLAAAMFTGLQLIIYLAFSFDTWQRNLNARAVRVASWFTVIWLPFFAAIWMSGFGSLYLTFLAPAQFTRRGSLTGVKKRISPGLINGLCFGIPAAAVAIIFPLQVYQASRMLDAMRKTRALTKNLNSLSATFQSSGSVNDNEVLLLVKDARKARYAVDSWRVLWATELGMWSLFTILAMAISVPLCTALVLSIHRRIRRIAATSAHIPVFSNPQMLGGDEPCEFSRSPYLTTTIAPESTGFCESPVSIRSVTFSGVGHPFPSTPSSAVQTPSTKEYSSQPFFPSPIPSSADLLGTNPKEKTHRQQSMSKSSMQSLRRMSQYAIFPGATVPQVNPDNKAELAELNRRYWHVIAQYLTVFVVMAVICAFALYEASSDIDVLTDCRRTNIAVVVISFTFCTLVIGWLAVTIYRLSSQNKRSGKHSPLAGPSPRSSNASSGSGLTGYTLNKNGPHQHRDVLQLRKTSAPPEICMDGGLGIEIEEKGRGSARPSLSEGRRRSSQRAVRASLDFREALSISEEEVESIRSQP